MPRLPVAIAVLLLSSPVLAEEAADSWWSLRPLSTASPPAPESRSPWSNPIDAFVAARRNAAGLTASPRATRRALVRRLSFDLLGLPPDPAAADQFLSDPRPGAWTRLVDRMLAHPHYGERWARHWLDIVRYGESQGFERDKIRPDFWRYRDWVAAAFNSDMAYDRFASLQLAGDVLHPNNPRAVVATGFLVAGSYDEVGNSQQSQAMKRIVRQDELEDIVSVVGQAFLGLTIHCARCHDHKFDPIPQQEYYRMAAALDGVRHGLRDLPAPASPGQSHQPAASLAARRRHLQQQLARLERPARDRILKQRRAARTVNKPPTPFARWNFDNGAQDSIGQLHGTLHGDGRIENGRLILPRRGFVTTPPIPRKLVARTLEAWVRLDDTQQRGGGLVAIQSIDGPVHDAIAFGELETGRWNLASENRNRTVSFRGPEELGAATDFVHIAFVFSADGSVRAFRNGQAYGRPIRTRGPITFPAGQARLVIGLRHPPTLRARHLRGQVDRVQLHLRALTAQEIQASAGPLAQNITEQEFTATLPLRDQQLRTHLRFEIAHLGELATRWNTWKSHAVSPRPPGVTHVLTRGDPKTPGRAVSPGGVSAVPGGPSDFRLPADAPDPPRRIALAKWITDSRNPLFSRVIANRIWLHHFGSGLVETPSDFGINGGLPSHPGLLDWLANQLVQHDWSLKHIHRLILTSRTYQQASRFRATAAAKDAGNRLIWRQLPRRLEAEALRDSLLQISGSLNDEIGGPGFYDFTTFTNNSQFYDVGDPIGTTFSRRSLYRTVIRSGRNRFLDAFDCPDPSTKTPRRAVTTTPLQALALLNSNFAMRMADRLAARVRRETDDTLPAHIRRMFRLCFARPPTAAETQASLSFAIRHGLPALARVLFNSNEFLYVD